MIAIAVDVKTNKKNNITKKNWGSTSFLSPSSSSSSYSILLIMILSSIFSNKCVVQAFTLRTSSSTTATRSIQTLKSTTYCRRIRGGLSLSTQLSPFQQQRHLPIQSTPYILNNILSNQNAFRSTPPALLTSSSSSFTSTSTALKGARRPNYQQFEPEPNPELDSFIEEATSTNDFFASETQFPTFESIGIQSPILLDRVHAFLQSDSDADTNAQIPKPSAIQAASYKAIHSNNDVTIGAETGSGKTLAYLLPLIDDILQSKLQLKNDSDAGVGEDEEEDNGGGGGSGKRYTNYDYARAIILVPNKELANQVIRMAAPLCGGAKSILWGPNGEQNVYAGSNSDSDTTDHEIVRLGFLPGELKTPQDYKPIRNSINDPSNNPPLDIIVCTPASLGPWGLNPKNINIFADVRTLIIDEADMLFDGGYLRQLENVLLGFRRADKLDSSFGVDKTQHVMVAATLPSMGTKSVDAYVQRKFPFATRVTMSGMHNARHYGLGQSTVWVEDDYDEMTPKKIRMERLFKMMKTKSGDDVRNDDDDDEHNDFDGVGLKGEKIMVFLNNVNDVDSATNALRRSGIEAVPFHAKMKLSERTENLARFRKFVAGEQEVSNGEDDLDVSDGTGSGPVPVLVCTDLAARGLDIPGVTSVVQLQFAGNVVTHLHRMGRCGRAGNRNGKGVVFYGGVESELVEVVIEAEQQQETMVLKGNDIEDATSNEEQAGKKGKVQAAFSRKRGFTRKRKKLRKAAREEQDGEDMYLSD